MSGDKCDAVRPLTILKTSLWLFDIVSVRLHSTSIVEQEHRLIVLNMKHHYNNPYCTAVESFDSNSKAANVSAI